jgi:hypothetical protein
MMTDHVPDIVAMERDSLRSMSFVPTPDELSQLLAQSRAAETARETMTRGPLLSKLHHLNPSFGLAPASLDPNDTILARLGRNGPIQDLGKGLSFIDDRNMPLCGKSCGPNGILFDCHSDRYGPSRINLFYQTQRKTAALLFDFLQFRNQHVNELFRLYVRKFIAHKEGGYAIDLSRPQVVLDEALHNDYDLTCAMFRRVLDEVDAGRRTLSECGVSCTSFCQTWMRRTVGNAQFSVMSPHFQTRFHVFDQTSLRNIATPQMLTAYGRLLTLFTNDMRVDYGTRQRTVTDGPDDGPAFVHLDGLANYFRSKIIRKQQSDLIRWISHIPTDADVERILNASDAANDLLQHPPTDAPSFARDCERLLGQTPTKIFATAVHPASTILSQPKPERTQYERMGHSFQVVMSRTTPWIGLNVGPNICSVFDPAKPLINGFVRRRSHRLERGPLDHSVLIGALMVADDFQFELLQEFVAFLDRATDTPPSPDLVEHWENTRQLWRYIYRCACYSTDPIGRWLGYQLFCHTWMGDGNAADFSIPSPHFQTFIHIRDASDLANRLLQPTDARSNGTMRPRHGIDDEMLRRFDEELPPLTPEALGTLLTAYQAILTHMQSQVERAGAKWTHRFVNVTELRKTVPNDLLVGAGGGGDTGLVALITRTLRPIAIAVGAAESFATIRKHILSIYTDRDHPHHSGETATDAETIQRKLYRKPTYSRRGIAVGEIDALQAAFGITDTNEYYTTIAGDRINEANLARWVDRLTTTSSDGSEVRSATYNTFYEEALVAQQLAVDIYMLTTIGGVKDYCDFDGRYPTSRAGWSVDELCFNIRHTMQGIVSLYQRKQTQHSILLDVGGDIVENIREKALTDLGRDELLLFAFTRLVYDQKIPPVTCRIHGPGADAHDAPRNVVERLCKAGFHRLGCAHGVFTDESESRHALLTDAEKRAGSDFARAWANAPSAMKGSTRANTIYTTVVDCVDQPSRYDSVVAQLNARQERAGTHFTSDDIPLIATVWERNIGPDAYEQLFSESIRDTFERYVDHTRPSSPSHLGGRTTRSASSSMATVGTNRWSPRRQTGGRTRRRGVE